METTSYGVKTVCDDARKRKRAVCNSVSRANMMQYFMCIKKTLYLKFYLHTSMSLLDGSRLVSEDSITSYLKYVWQMQRRITKHSNIFVRIDLEHTTAFLLKLINSVRTFRKIANCYSWKHQQLRKVAD